MRRRLGRLSGVHVMTVVIGTDVATATVDKRGRAEVELDVEMPGATASR